MHRSLLFIGIGSFIGGICRYLLQQFVQNNYPSSIPVGTLIVNITGCFAIGLVYELAAKGNLLSPEMRLFLATGICGGYTTFSSFAYESVSMVLDGEFARAQELTPVGYMEQIDKAEQEANQKYLAYISAAAHSGRMKKVERMRQQLLDGIINSRNNVRGIPFYKGEKELKQSSIEYLDLLYHVFNEDYAKIVNMEDIAEQSFNEMQAYLLLQEKTSETLNDAQSKRNDASRTFAEKYNIRLVEETSAMGEKMKKAAEVIKYRNEIYLLFFKCNWQWGEMSKSIQSNKVNDIEQARNAVISYAEDGLKSLGMLKAFEGDAALVNVCRQMLSRYKHMAEKEVPGITTFVLASENFEKVKKSFDAKPERERTKQDIDHYNKAVNDMNAGVNRYNAANKNLYETGRSLVDLWQKADKDFSNEHTPYFRR